MLNLDWIFTEYFINTYWAENEMERFFAELKREVNKNVPKEVKFGST